MAHQKPIAARASARLWRNRSVKQKKEAENNDIISRPAKQVESLEAGDLLGEAATIADICAAITKLVNTVSEANDGETELQSSYCDIAECQTDTLWEDVCNFAAQLARARSSSLDDVSGKISIWRHLAPEQIVDNKFPTIDETLLLSIIGDVERLRSGQTG